MTANGTQSDQPTPGLPAGLTADIRALIEMMARGGIVDLELKTAALKLHLHARDHTVAATAAAATVAHALHFDAAGANEPDGIVVTAPMIGTFYRSPAPNEPPFADAGDHVEPGQTIGIIEAMKIMNEIPVEVAGTIVEFLATSGQPVEYGQPLVRLTPR